MRLKTPIFSKVLQCIMRRRRRSFSPLQVELVLLFLVPSPLCENNNFGDCFSESGTADASSYRPSSSSPLKMQRGPAARTLCVWLAVPVRWVCLPAADGLPLRLRRSERRRCIMGLGVPPRRSLALSNATRERPPTPGYPASRPASDGDACVQGADAVPGTRSWK